SPSCSRVSPASKSLTRARTSSSGRSAAESRSPSLSLAGRRESRRGIGMNRKDLGWVTSLMDEPDTGDELLAGTTPTASQTAQRGSEPSPFRFDLLPRPHLEGQLAGVLAHAVTVLEAAAGYGKTATLWQWYQLAKQKGVPAARIPLTSFDPASVVEQMNNALRGIGVSIQNGAWKGVEEPSLVLIDNYPIDPTRELDDLFSALMNNLPPELHVVVASRAAARWSLSKLLLQGDAQRLGIDDLRFTPREVEQYLDAY